MLPIVDVPKLDEKSLFVCTLTLLFFCFFLIHQKGAPMFPMGCDGENFQGGELLVLDDE